MMTSYCKLPLILLFLIVLSFGGYAQGQWDAADLFIESEETLNVLTDPHFIDLENHIFDYTKNSWCSEEKAKLILELVVLTKPNVCVEIGAFTGSCTVPMLAGLNLSQKWSRLYH